MYQVFHWLIKIIKKKVLTREKKVCHGTYFEADL